MSRLNERENLGDISKLIAFEGIAPVLSNQIIEEERDGSCETAWRATQSLAISTPCYIFRQFHGMAGAGWQQIENIISS